MKKVITYQSANGKTINVCKSCENKLEGNWPKDEKGFEYCSVSHGLHKDVCSICNK